MFFWIAVFANSLGIFPLIVLKTAKKRLLPEARFIGPYVWLIALGSAYELVGTLLLRINTTYWFHFYCFADFFCLNYFFYRLFERKYRTLNLAFSIVFICVFIILMIGWSEISNLQSDAFLGTLSTLLVSTFAILWFRQLAHDTGTEHLWERPVFYLISGLFLYYSGTFFLFLMSDSITNNPRMELMDFWIINILLTLLLRILLILGIWKAKAK